MKTIRPKSDYEKRGKDIKRFPNVMDNKNWGVKRTPKTHNIVIKDTKTGQVFGYKTIEEVMSMTFTQFLINEATDTSSKLPAPVYGELTTLIRKGAKDLNQLWKNAFELVHTAYHIANVARPDPSDKAAWSQYEDLLKLAVKSLSDTRGRAGEWRMSNPVIAESSMPEQLDEGKSHRIFARIQNIGFDDSIREVELVADSIDEVIHQIMNKARSVGKKVEITPHSANQVKLTVYTSGLSKRRDDQIILIKDWSLSTKSSQMG